MPLTPTKKIWMDGKMVAWEKAQVHVLTHTLHYGTGAFEGIRAYKTPDGVAIFRLREHMQRLLRSCKILMINVPYTLDELCEAAVQIVRVNELNDGCYLRPIVYLGYGEYVNSSLAKAEAILAGYDEAIMLGPDGRVSECTGENLFIVRDGLLISPPPSEAGALSGITLSSIVKIANDLGYSVSFEALRRDDLYIADEAFLTGTAAEVVPIGSVDDRVVGDGTPGHITKAIQTTYFQAVRGEVAEYEGWLTRV